MLAKTSQLCVLKALRGLQMLSIKNEEDHAPMDTNDAYDHIMRAAGCRRRCRRSAAHLWCVLALGEEPQINSSSISDESFPLDSVLPPTPSIRRDPATDCDLIFMLRRF